jgi:hypothetical protein
MPVSVATELLAAASVASVAWLLPSTSSLSPFRAPSVRETPRAEEYGWNGLLNSRLNDGCFRLLAADVDSDGDTDLAIINNPKARLDFLLQRQPGEALRASKATDAGEGANDFADEVHFERDSFPTDQKVSSLAIGDLNGDGRNDLAFVGDSGKLTIAWRGAKGGFADRVRFDLDELSNVPQSLRVGDLDGDGRQDVLVLGKRKTQIFLQGADGRLAEAAELLNATASPDGFAVCDLDGDRKNDLLYVKAEADAPLRFRLNRGNGEMGPERLFPFTEIRQYAVTDLDADGKVDLAAVRRRSGRVALLELAEPGPAPKTGELALSSPRLVAYAAQKDEKPRDELLADFDGDGRPELLVCEPSAARLVLHRRDPDGLASRGEACANLVGARQPRLADLDGDGRPELVVAAPEEGAFGVSLLDANGRPGFPETRGYKGEALLALDAADLDGGGRSSLVGIVSNGKAAAKKWYVQLLAGGAPDVLPAAIELPKLATDPNDLWLIDLNRDGLRDAFLTLPTELPKVLLGTKAAGGGAGPFGFVAAESTDAAGLGVLKGVARTALWHGDADGDGASELLVPGPNFVRALTFDAKGAPKVVAQWNLEEPSAKVGAVAAGDLDGDGRPEVIAHDKSTRSLRVLRQVNQAAKTVARVELGDVDPKALRVADIDGNGRQDIVLLCADRFAVVQAGVADASFVETDDFESPLKNAFLDQIAFGDVNGDGITDAVMTDSNRHLITIAAHVGGELAHVLQFPVYEESIFERDGGGGREPREVVIADVTGDRKQDLVILVHDRVIVYPQE